jgi:hypothetical protein
MRYHHTNVWGAGPMALMLWLDGMMMMMMMTTTPTNCQFVLRCKQTQVITIMRDCTTHTIPNPI